MRAEHERGAAEGGRGGDLPEGAEPLMDDLRFEGDTNPGGEENQVPEVNHDHGDRSLEGHGRSQDPGQLQPQATAQPLTAMVPLPPPPRRRPRILYKPTPSQVQELERVFQETQNPDALTRSVVSSRYSGSFPGVFPSRLSPFPPDPKPLGSSACRGAGVGS